MFWHKPAKRNSCCIFPLLLEKWDPVLETQVGKKSRIARVVLPSTLGGFCNIDF